VGWVVLPAGASPGVQSKYAEILGVHAALVHTGDIFYFTGSQYQPEEHLHHQFDHARLFDCATGAITAVSVLPTMTDLFCCGHALLADGRLLVAGGTESYGIAPGHFTVDWEGQGDTSGIRETWISTPLSVVGSKRVRWGLAQYIRI
jgi:hypothetical protein